MALRTALVTGAGAGIGAELCRRLAAREVRVFACPRAKDSPDLTGVVEQAAGRVEVIPMDVADDDSVDAAVREVSGRTKSLDALFNNAGIYPRDGGSLEMLEFDAIRRAHEVNTLGPLRVTRAFLPLLRKGDERRIANVTSLMGSIADNGSGGSWAYRMSKTGLNMATRNLAHELGPSGFVVTVLHPGWVQTKMGGLGAPLDVESSVHDILSNALEGGPERNGRFFGPGGEELPW